MVTIICSVVVCDGAILRMEGRCVQKDASSNENYLFFRLVLVSVSGLICASLMNEMSQESDDDVILLPDLSSQEVRSLLNTLYGFLAGRTHSLDGISATVANTLRLDLQTAPTLNYAAKTEQNTECVFITDPGRPCWPPEEEVDIGVLNGTKDQYQGQGRRRGRKRKVKVLDDFVDLDAVEAKREPARDQYQTKPKTPRLKRRAKLARERRPQESRPRSRPSEEVQAFERKVKSGLGKVILDLKRQAYEDSLTSPGNGQDIAFMTLVGLTENDEGFTMTPLAWTLRDEGEEERKKQFDRYTSALRSVYGLSEVEAVFHPMIFNHMSASKESKKVERMKFALRRELAVKTDQQLRDVLNEQKVRQACDPSDAKPLKKAVDEDVSLEVSLCDSQEQFDGLALVVAKNNDNTKPTYVLTLSVDRQKDAEEWLALLMDVWAADTENKYDVPKTESVMARVLAPAKVALIHETAHALLDPANATLRKVKAEEVNAGQIGGADESYTCEICGKTLKNAATMYLHARTHKTYECDVCGLAVRGHFRLGAHKRRAHPEAVAATPCDVCGAEFRDKAALKLHTLKSHVAEKDWPFQCLECARGFARHPDLVAHQ